MGLLDRAVAKRRLLAEQAARLASELDAEMMANPDYAAARAEGAATRETGIAMANQAAELAVELREGAGSSETGQQVCTGARTAAGVLATLPVISAVSDAARSRHGADAQGRPRNMERGRSSINIPRSIAVAAATVAASVALVGCAADGITYQTKAACQDAVDETTTEAALKEVLATKAECVKMEARIGMRRYAGEDHDL